MQQTFKISISGQVQGVGFRPYTYTLATQFNLKGTVSNNKEGVIIYVTGLQNDVQKFYEKLTKYPPPVSRIKTSKIEEINTIEFSTFSIIASNKEGQVNLPLTPDFALCNNCKQEIEDNNNKRANYAFTTCVNCGPRWSITNVFPFERNHTSIAKFPMCKSCSQEYTNPANRRFHSQTNTCKTCGISLELNNNRGAEISSDDIFKTTAQLLREGNIIAIKNTSGYLLCCDAENSEVIKRLRRLKNRAYKPFAVLYPSLEKLKKELLINKKEAVVLQSSERPITIISLLNYKGKIAVDDVAPKLSQLGVMLPYTGILQLLANQITFPIVATSGNIHGSPILSKKTDVEEKLSHVADYFVHHNLEIKHPQDDSVLKFSNKFNVECIFRRSRGYAPNYLDCQVKTNQKILALGADLKNSIAFFPNEYLYVSQYIGNLENYEVYNRFLMETQGFISIFNQNPQVILADKHPNYHSTRYGLELSKKDNSQFYQIQHHKAHFASVLGEYSLFNDENILGVVWDGTGFGDDGNIWGGEFFTYRNHQIKRVNHFEYFNWISGDKMSKEPRLSLFSLMHGERQVDFIKSKFTPDELNVLKTVKKNNKLKTSSVGRLFDAVASLLDICDYNSYEGEAAIVLENKVHNYNINKCTDYLRSEVSTSLPTFKIVEAIQKDLVKGIEIQQIISNFLFTLASGILKVAAQNQVSKICLSGGVFQNTTLIDMLIESNKGAYKLYFNRNLAPNDENIAFGQIMYHLHCKS